jgi:alpha-glucoside transport system permease protein
MYKEGFLFGNYGLAATIAVIVLILIIPMMIINIRRFKGQEAIR